MEEEFGDKHIPSQEIGAQMDAVENRTFEDETEAMAFFAIAKRRLLNVNLWASLAGSELSSFQLANAFGNPKDGLAREGDFISIDIPGPGPRAGHGYDWVQIESILEEQEPGMEVISLRARSSDNPLSTSKETAHFLTEQATSTFQVKRIGRTVYAEEHGRNEQANTYTSGTTDNIRNMLVGWAATLGLSYPQWKSLVKGILGNV